MRCWLLGGARGPGRPCLRRGVLLLLLHRLLDPLRVAAPPASARASSSAAPLLTHEQRFVSSHKEFPNIGPAFLWFDFHDCRALFSETLLLMFHCRSPFLDGHQWKAKRCNCVFLFRITTVNSACHLLKRPPVLQFFVWDGRLLQNGRRDAVVRTATTYYLHKTPVASG